MDIGHRVMLDTVEVFAPLSVFLSFVVLFEDFRDKTIFHGMYLLVRYLSVMALLYALSF